MDQGAHEAPPESSVMAAPAPPAASAYPPDGPGTAPVAPPIPPGPVPPGRGHPYFSEDQNVDRAKLDAWAEQEIFPKGWTLDMGTMEIIDPINRRVVGPIPTFYRVN